MTQQLSTQTNQKPSVPAANEHRHDLRGMINHFFNLIDFPQNSALTDLEPKIEIREDKKEVVVSAEIAGIAPEDMEIEVSADGYLTLSGEKRQENAEASRDSYFSEISYGSFKRTISLPWDLDFEGADAEYDNGTLKVSIPKLPTEQTKKKKLSIGKNRKK